MGQNLIEILGGDTTLRPIKDSIKLRKGTFLGVWDVSSESLLSKRGQKSIYRFLGHERWLSLGKNKFSRKESWPGLFPQSMILTEARNNVCLCLWLICFEPREHSPRAGALWVSYHIESVLNHLEFRLERYTCFSEDITCFSEDIFVWP